VYRVTVQRTQLAAPSPNDIIPSVKSLLAPITLLLAPLLCCTRRPRQSRLMLIQKRSIRQNAKVAQLSRPDSVGGNGMRIVSNIAEVLQH